MSYVTKLKGYGEPICIDRRVIRITSLLTVGLVLHYQGLNFRGGKTCFRVFPALTGLL